MVAMPLTLLLSAYFAINGLEPLDLEHICLWFNEFVHSKRFVGRTNRLSLLFFFTSAIIVHKIDNCTYLVHLRDTSPYLLI